MKKKVVKDKSSGGAVVSDGKILLIYWESKNSYEIPKGRIENGESPEVACAREILEETGYVVSIDKFLLSRTIKFEWDGVSREREISYYRCTPQQYKNPSREAGEDFSNVWVNIEDAKKLIKYSDMLDVINALSA